MRLPARFLAALFLAAVGAACTTAPAPQAPDAGPPTRVLLGWSGDAATSRAVTWRTAGEVTGPQAQLARAGADAAPQGAITTVPAGSRNIRLDDGRTVVHHRADFTGLQPAARYVYRVGDGRQWSGWHAFETADTAPAPFRFIYLGDAQNGLTDAWPPVVRAAAAAAPDARFVVHAGDLVAEGYDDSLWQAWTDAMQPLSFSIPNVPVPGNHDVHRSPSVDASGSVFEVSRLWTAHFALPRNGPAGLGELAGQNYVLDYQGVRFIVVDANPWANTSYVDAQRTRVQAAQVAWLRDVVAHNPNPWTIVVQHQPMFAVAKGRDFPEMRAGLQAIYEEGGVDLVLQGHDHLYARTHKVRGPSVVAPGERGVIYSIAVSGSKRYAVNTAHATLMALIRENIATFQVISVSPTRLAYESRGADGSLNDAFEITKAGAAPSLYVNRAPGAPAATSGPAR